MTALDTRTGEITGGLMTEAQARALFDSIRTAAMDAADRVENVKALIEEARDREAWRSAGYLSWTACAVAEFGGALPKLERDARRELVASLTEVGMSSRAIAPIVGVDKETVNADRRSGGRNLPPDAADECDPDAEIVDAELLDEEPTAPKPITGMDGKTYPKPVQQTRPAPGRSPFTGEFYEAVEKVRKAINALAKTTQDDRFTRNADQVAATYRSDLIRAQDALAGVIEQLPTPGA